jgi:hypothetical protein
MKIRLPIKACATVTVIALLGARGVARPAQATSGETAKHQKENAVTGHASGTFDVKLMPQPVVDGEAGIGRMSIDQQFHGDLEAVSKGEMLSSQGTIKGSAGYVAIERVSGTLQGRKGSFVLQHNATMNRGTPQLNIIVLPNSGTDQLAGVAGMMTIKIDQGQHFYEFDCTFSDAK